MYRHLLYNTAIYSVLSRDGFWWVLLEGGGAELKIHFHHKTNLTQMNFLSSLHFTSLLFAVLLLHVSASPVILNSHDDGTQVGEFVVSRDLYIASETAV